MGHTHYWYRPTEIPQSYWDSWTADVRTIIAASAVPLAYGGRTPGTPPEISQESVRFNGIGKDAHEDFFIARRFVPERWSIQDEHGWFEFCKTAAKPYDVVVCACLIRLARWCAEGIKICSDGTPEEWEPARQFCKDLFGFAAVPLR